MDRIQKPIDRILTKTKMCKFFASGCCQRGAACGFAHSQSALQSAPDLMKTQLCIAFERNGFCRDGSACKYAHGRIELRTTARPDPEFIATATTESSAHGSDAEVSESTRLDCQGTPMSRKEVEHFLKDNNTWSSRPLSRVATASSLASTCIDTNSPVLEDSHDLRQSSGSPSLDGSDVRSLTEADGTSPPSIAGHVQADRRSSAQFRKTKMCKFFSQGICHKGALCGFAHEERALLPPPDLYRTRLCLAIERSGYCREGDRCRFAHGTEQLRTYGSQYEHTIVKSANVGCPILDTQDVSDEVPPTFMSDQSDMCRVQKPPLAALDLDNLVPIIRNTFIHFEVPRSPKLGAQVNHRSASAGARIVHHI